VIVLATDAWPASEAALRIGGRRLPCWLASPGSPDRPGPREFLACDPVEVVRGAAGNAGGALDSLMAAWGRGRDAWQAGPGTPVAVGFFSYDLGRHLERPRRPPGSAAAQPSSWPVLEFRCYDAFYVWDPAAGRGEIWAAHPQAGQALLEKLNGSAAGVVPGPGPAGFVLEPLQPLEPPERHLQAVSRVQAYLHAGDAYQVNLARRLVAICRSEGPPGLALFTRLQAESPAPHALWLADTDLGRALIGNSPERFLHLDVRGEIVTEPIKGTRPRGSGEDDQAWARHLVGDPKDHAEHVMIVDLERNDLGRICQTGSVVVEDPLRLLPLPSVFHLVTTVRGRLRPGVELPQILRACFPGGSITGAPKIRAMEIIDELEAACRGPYTGATGWLGAAGDLDLAVAIRTALLEGEQLTLWVGGGIVVDSIPAAELEETTVKARAFARLADGAALESRGEHSRKT
jgi:anthranilate/para-aminobenzoate synthase component I